MATELAVHPVTPHRWDDLVMLFGERRSPTRPIMRLELQPGHGWGGGPPAAA